MTNFNLNLFKKNYVTGKATKLAHLLESASLNKSIWIKIMKKYVLNS